MRALVLCPALVALVLMAAAPAHADPGVGATVMRSLVGPALANHPRANRVVTSGVAARAGGLALAAAGVATAVAPAAGVGDRGLGIESTAGGLLAIGGATLFLAGTFYELHAHTEHRRERRADLQHVTLSPMMVSTTTTSTLGFGLDGHF